MGKKHLFFPKEEATTNDTIKYIYSGAKQAKKPKSLKIFV